MAKDELVNRKLASRRIRERWPDGDGPRIVAVTASAAQGHRGLDLAAGRNEYLTKPFRAKPLVAARARVKSRQER